MKRANLLDEGRHQWGKPEVASVYESPCLKILNLRFDPGQSLLMYSDQIQGDMSLVVIDGQGEFMGEEARRYPLNRGDVIVSLMGEPYTFLAKTTLRLLVTITLRGSSCEVGTPAPFLNRTVIPRNTKVVANT
jgi:hypothetical protein